MLDMLFPDDHEIIHNGCTGVLPDETWVHGILNRERLDERWPFTWWEVSYRTRGRIYVPQGMAFAARQQFLIAVLGPIREALGVSISIPKGGAFDPVTDGQGRKITHRSSLGKNDYPDDPCRLSRSQHGFQPYRRTCRRRSGYGPEIPGPTGTAWDFRPKHLDEKLREEIVVWLKKLEMPPFLVAAQVKGVSIGVYGPESGNFVHGDLRRGSPARWRSKAPKKLTITRAGWW